jgi:hypothetical protein
VPEREAAARPPVRAAVHRSLPARQARWRS